MAVFDRMIVATFLSLIFVPCIYVLIQSATELIRRRK
jgi:multidrug efflux pump subunit AcrB